MAAQTPPDATAAAPETPFPPLPLRPRGTLEMLDVAAKLYRQYFGVLLGWSAIVTLIGTAISLMGCGLGSFLLTPLSFGSTACCLAAAVRGQRVTFGQCWQFTQPRFGWLLLTNLVSGLLLVALCIPFAIVLGVLAVAASALGVVMIVVVVVVASVVLVFALVWVYLVPIVVCFEDNQRNLGALTRAYELPKGNWVRIICLVMLLGLVAGMVLAIAYCVVGIVISGGNLASVISNISFKNTDALLPLLTSFALVSSFVSMLLTPLFNLCMAVYYLDVRTRKEALDLEWAAHVATPVTPLTSYGNRPGAPVGLNATNPAFLNRPQPYPPGYAPPGSAAPGSVAPGYPPNYPPNYPPPSAPPSSAGMPPVVAQQPYSAPPTSSMGAPSGSGVTPTTAVPSSTAVPPPAPNPAGQSAFTAPPAPVQLPVAAPPISTAPPTAPAFSTVTDTALPPTGIPPAPPVVPAPPVAAPVTAPAAPPAMPPTVSQTPSVASEPEPLDFAPLPATDFAIPPSTGAAPLGDAVVSGPTPPTTTAATTTCPECGANVPRGQRYCMTCGAQLPAS